MILRRSFLFLILGIIFTACGVVKEGSLPVKQTDEPAENKLAEANEFLKATDHDFENKQEIEAFLKQAYQDWEGVPYAMGRHGYEGIDCSEFMQVVFEDYFSYIIPRTAREQFELGRQVKKSESRAGDLLFFKAESENLHVGVMINSEQFLHVSKTSGVEISDINNKHWEENYLISRRILE